MDHNLNIDLEAYEKVLQKHPGSFVSITHISNAFGLINPVKKLTELAHKHACKVMIDGAQALAHLPIDIKDIGADFYAVSAHKAYGPTGVGALYGRFELLQGMRPYQGGGSMIDDVSFEGSTFLDPPWRFEAGTQAIAEVIGFKTALEYLHKLQGVKEYEEGLHKYARQRLKDISDIECYTQAENTTGNISFTIKGVHHDDIGILLSKQNIMLRTGHHCALPIMKKLGIEGTVRLSFSLYNSEEDIDKTIEGIEKALRILR